MNTRKWRLAFAGLLIGSLAITTSDAFIFRRMRARRASGRGAFSSFRQSRGMGMLFRRRSSSSSSRSSSSAMSGRNAKWNVEGQWNYSTAFLAEHLAEVHGIDTRGMSREQMQLAHDNAHNGVPIMEGVGPIMCDGACPTCPDCPGGCCPTEKPADVVEVIEEPETITIIEQPVMSSGGCPNGQCPTSRGSSSTRRRGLFRRW